jgi:spore maturation protein B
MNNIAQIISNGLLLSFIVGIPVFGAIKRIDVFQSFVTGAKTGFETSIGIIPYLVAMLVAIAMLRASGFFELMYSVLSPLLHSMGFPEDLLPLALIRPFSGSAATGVMAEIIHDHGGDALVSKMAATIMGSTETTFYVIAVYFGSIGITRIRHAIWAGLLADFAGVLASVYVCQYLFA